MMIKIDMANAKVAIASIDRKESNMCMKCGCGIKDKKNPKYGKGPKKGK